MMNESEIYARLTALHSALVEKLGAQPYFPPELTLHQRGVWDVALYKDGSPLTTLHRAAAGTPEACLEAAHAFVAAMPDRTVKARRDWHDKLATVIDEGHALSLPDDVMQPLRTGSQAMAKNLLAAPEAV